MLENNITIIIGGGHAGVEAAFALSRVKLKSIIVTMDKDAVGRLSCNPAVGGLAKSHLVKEIDALGGIMGHAADACGIQFKTLNKTKGRAVWALRAQVDKKKYPIYINKLIKKNTYISVLEEEAVGLIIKSGVVKGINLKNKKTIHSSSVIITSGTFLNGLIHIGINSYRAGRMGEKGSYGLTESLLDNGFESGRLKTGTPPRVSKKSLDLSKCKLAPGEDNHSLFSLFSSKHRLEQETCYLVDTNAETHSIINNNLSTSAMFSGKIKGVGPRYCPSIEDKVFRFKERSSHHLFLEPEWSNSDQIYINGFSTSLSERVQKEALQSISAFRNVEIIRPGYAIEYDYIPPRQLKSTLEAKGIRGLFLAGQMNGTSGYEEAAAQGLIAGINAALYVKREEPFILNRQTSYIGVMIDDLITSHLNEPYRMFTSRAENRLMLRSDNAYTRLSRLAIDHKLVTSVQALAYCEYFKTRDEVFRFTDSKSLNSNLPGRVDKLIKQPDVSIYDFDISLIKNQKYIQRCLFEVETSIKYEGYIQNEIERIAKNKSLENLPLPVHFNYKNLPGLSLESIERLSSVNPETLGQASRVSGIRPTDITIIGSHIKSSDVSRET